MFQLETLVLGVLRDVVKDDVGENFKMALKFKMAATEMRNL